MDESAVSMGLDGGVQEAKVGGRLRRLFAILIFSFSAISRKDAKSPSV